MKYDAVELKTILDYDSSLKLVLPNFQRDFVWVVDAQKRLLQSILSSVPVGAVLMLHGGPDDFAHRPLCYKEDVNSAVQDCIFLLDGQQRTSTMKTFFSDCYSKEEWKRFHEGEPDNRSWIDLWEALPLKLRNRWFVDVRGDLNDDSDPFGYRELKVPDQNEIFEPEEYEDHIVYFPVYKTKVSQWHNPGYAPRDAAGDLMSLNRRRQNISENAAGACLVPLWELYHDPRGRTSLHKRSLQIIAAQQRETLKSRVADGERNVVDLLGHLEPDIASYVEEEDQDRIDEVWVQLSTEWVESVANQLAGIIGGEIPTIELPSEHLKRGIAIFETINQPGTPLSVFDLVVARMARSESSRSLTEEILEILQKEIEVPEALSKGVHVGSCCTKWSVTNLGVIEDQSPSKDYKELFLNTLSLTISLKAKNLDEISIKEIKRSAQLALSPEDISKSFVDAVHALNRALVFLAFRCGISRGSDLSYRLMALPIAVAFLDDDVWSSAQAHNRIEYWYWSSVFSGQYRERQNDRAIKDVKSLVKWVRDEVENPYSGLQSWVLASPGYSDQETLLRKGDEINVSRSLENTLLQYVLSRCPKDMQSGTAPVLKSWMIGKEQSALNDHHITPLGSATSLKESTAGLRSDKSHPLNSVLNRTLISASANGTISDKTPERYLKELDDTVAFGHLIPYPVAEWMAQNTGETTDQYFDRVMTRRY